MKKSTSTIRSQKINQLKTNEKLDGILTLDNRGYSYYNDGFPHKNFNVHGLFRLSDYFFPEGTNNSIVAVQGTQTLTTIQKSSEGDTIATRISKKA